MSIASDFGAYDATGLAELVRDREVEPIELIDEAIERIERLNPTINAVVVEITTAHGRWPESRSGRAPSPACPFCSRTISPSVYTPDVPAVPVAEHTCALLLTLAAGPRTAGEYAVHWDGRDQRGRSLASGVYIYRLQSGQQVQSRKLLLLK